MNTVSVVHRCEICTDHSKADMDKHSPILHMTKHACIKSLLRPILLTLLHRMSMGLAVVWLAGAIEALS